MKKAIGKRILALLLAVFTAFALAACEFTSSTTSTTTVSTSVTDADGNTTTNTTTTEVGASLGKDGLQTTNQTTKETTTTPAEKEETDEDWNAFVDHMYATYTGGAEGRNDDGDYFYYAFNDDNDDVILTIVSADGQDLSSREGVLIPRDDHYVLYSEVMDDETPFTFSEQGENGDFTITFLGDGDVAKMHLVDQKTIIEDILARIKEFE